MEPLLTIDNFSLTFPPGDRESEPVRALCGVDLRVEAGAPTPWWASPARASR